MADLAKVSPLHVLSNDEAARLRQRLDSYSNSTTGIGGSFDKRLGGFATVRLFDYSYWADLYRGNDMAARLVDVFPEEMTRKGWRVAIEEDHEVSEAVDNELQRLEVVTAFLQALKWERAFGGAGIFIGANDGQTADQPLNEDNISSIDFLLPLDTLELVPNSYYTNPLEKGYGLPASYRLNRFGTISPVPPQFGGVPSTRGLGELMGGTTLQAGGLAQLALRASDWNFLPIVHESRIIRFSGIFVNRLQLRANRYWGDSIFVRAEEVLRDFGLSWASASILLQDFAQSVVKMKGLAALQAKSGPKAYQDAAAMVEAQRSTARSLVLDSEDSYERSRTPLEGLPDMLDKFARRLAATGDLPVSRLFGESPAGLSATGDTEQEWWYDKVEGGQRNHVRPKMNRFITLLFKSKDGPTKGKEPGRAVSSFRKRRPGEKEKKKQDAAPQSAPTQDRGNWSVQFNPLRQIDPKMEADRRLAIAQADHIYITDSVVTPEEVAVTRFAGDDYNGERLELLEEDPNKRALAAAEAAEAAQPMPGEDDPAAKPEPGDAGASKPAPEKKDPKK